MIIKILEFLFKIPALVSTLDKWLTEIISWYLSKQTKDTLSEIADAAAFASKAKTKEERYEAAKKWQDAISRTRYIK